MSSVAFAPLRDTIAIRDVLLAQIAAQPITAQSVAPHVAEQFLRDGYVSLTVLPSPFTDGNGKKVPHYAVTAAGRKRIAQ